jgi:hypothetical protein
VDYREIVANPLDAVVGVYERFDIDLDEQTYRAMQDWVDSNPPGLHGDHRYSAEEFGLTAGDIREQFDAYLDRYGLRP